MKKFIKENWFKFSLIILILIIILSYFLFIKPIQERKETLANNIRCQQEGSKLSENDKKSFLLGYDKTKEYKIIGDPEFKFINELNTCLYKGWNSTFNDNFYITNRFIEDVYSNKKLIESVEMGIGGKEASFTNNEEYKLLESKYFPK